MPVVDSLVEVTSKSRFANGQIVAGYEILGVLGEGGMGIVYDARDVVLGRRVAIKAPLFSIYGAALRREAQALAALASPSFVKVHHLAHHDDIDLLVMERLVGETLAQSIDRLRDEGRLYPIADAIDLLGKIADALSSAHRAGVAQRDLKASNIMLVGERVVLFDLGLFIPEVLIQDDVEVSGSAEYIAPEVLRRDVKRGEGPLVDLYALGVLAFELLTGQTPLAGDSLQETLANHLRAKPADVRTLRPEVPPELAALVAELLAKAPGDRPPSAEAVVWQLEDLRARPDRPASSRNAMRVIAIDDEVHVGVALKKALESAFPRMEVEATTDPRRAATERVDIVLVDLNMPRENGVEVCMSLLALPREMRPTIVAMSAEANPADVAVLKSLGVSHFVPKGADFVAAMSDIVGRIRAEHVTW
jgi:serine/threonine-protein kinase